MVGRHLVQIGAGQLAALSDLGIVVLVADDPLSGRFPGRRLPDLLLDLGQTAQIQIDVGELGDAGAGGVRMGVDEAGRDRHPLGVDHLYVWPGEVPDIVRAPYCSETTVLDGEGLRPRQRVVHRVDGCVEQHQVRGGAAAARGGVGARVVSCAGW